MRTATALASAAFALAAFACANGHGSARDAGADSASPNDAGADVKAGPPVGLIDRAGRPLVGVILIPSPLEDDYNAVSTFDTQLPRLLEDALTSRLHELDTIALGDAGPDPVDWPLEGGAHPLAPMFAIDALLVDTAKPCTLADGGFAASYLEIERETIAGAFGLSSAHATCGGRTPTDDVVDTTLTLLVTGYRDGGPAVSQGVADPTKAATTTFPYLADPN
jgi:hypothetical protein